MWHPSISTVAMQSACFDVVKRVRMLRMLTFQYAAPIDFSPLDFFVPYDWLGVINSLLRILIPWWISDAACISCQNLKGCAFFKTYSHHLGWGNAVAWADLDFQPSTHTPPLLKRYTIIVRREKGVEMHFFAMRTSGHSSMPFTLLFALDGPRLPTLPFRSFLHILEADSTNNFFVHLFLLPRNAPSLERTWWDQAESDSRAFR